MKNRKLSSILLEFTRYTLAIALPIVAKFDAICHVNSIPRWLRISLKSVKSWKRK